MISFRKTRRSRALGGSRHSYANRSAVSPRCYPFGNLCVANFAGFPVALESVMQDDALRNQRPNLPLIYARRKVPLYGWRSAKLNHFPGRITRDRALTSTVMSHERFVFPRNHRDNSRERYSHRIANNCWLELASEKNDRNIVDFCYFSSQNLSPLSLIRIVVRTLRSRSVQLNNGFSK